MEGYDQINPNQNVDNSVNSQFDNNISSQLQLFSYDLKTSTEEPVIKYQIEEMEELEEVSYVNQRQGVDKLTDLITQLKEKINVQYNVRFSTEFGEKEQRDEIEYVGEEAEAEDKFLCD